MLDLVWNIATGDLQTTGSGSTLDFAVSSDPLVLSPQNGAIILLARCMNSNQPVFGIGIGENIGGNTTTANVQYNRWKAQVNADGAVYSQFRYNQVLQDVELTVQYQ